MSRKIYAYVLFDNKQITGITCISCLKDGDNKTAPVHAKGAVICSRCREVAE